jgi:UDP-glucose:(heptosyl)LPS alpha-1,3-glucosyltransferase
MKKNVTDIAVIIPKFGLIGGAENFALQTTRKLASNPSFRVHVFSNEWNYNGNNIRFSKVPYIRFPRHLITPSFAYFANRRVDGMGFDLVHSHDRIFRADIFTMHGIPHRLWPLEVRRRNRMSLFDRATARVEEHLIRKGGCRRFVAVSNLTKQKFLQEYSDIDPEKIEIVHPGVDMDGYRFPDRNSYRQDLLSRFGFQPDDTIFLFVSMNFDIKGLDALMGGLSRMRIMHPEIPWRLLVVGKGEIRIYENFASGLNIGDRVVFSGAVQKEELSCMYGGSDVFCMPSKFDTFGMAALEAMAASLPVLISSNVGAKDLVKNEVNGFIVNDPDMEDEIASRVVLLSNPEIRRRMGDEAFRTALSCSWDSVASRMEEIYEAVLKEKRTGGGRFPVRETATG